VFKKSTNSKISAFIFVVPPVVLLIFAIIIYLVFLNSQISIDKQIVTKEENILYDISLKNLESRTKTINNFIDNNSSTQEIKKFLKSITIKDTNNIVIFDKNNKLIYKSVNVNSNILKKLLKINGIYKNNNILALSINKNRLHWKIVAFYDKNNYQKYLNSIKNTLMTSARTTISKGLYWLAISWFLLLLISLLIAYAVLNRLKAHEKTIKDSNENIIFQSRQALLGELLPMIAHQWRQPLNKIAAVLMRIRFELANGKPNVNILDRQSQQIEDSVELMSNTIDDFRTFYRPKEEAEYVDIALLIRKAFYFLDELLDRKKIKVNNSLFSTKVKIHPNEFLQVMINLIKNASDAVSVQGNISVSMKEAGNFIEIRVEDDGTGIPQNKLEKIFEPHESTKQGSMGLGLYMSKLIIESRMGGEIKAYNTPRGAGFLIKIPRG